jgi:hypothetical protein
MKSLGIIPFATCVLKHLNSSQLNLQEPEDVVQIKRQISSLTFQLQRMDKSDPKFNTTIDQINSLHDSIPMQWRDYPD